MEKLQPNLTRVPIMNIADCCLILFLEPTPSRSISTSIVPSTVTPTPGQQGKLIRRLI